LLAAGLILGSLAPTPPEAAPPRTPEGDYVLQADLHVHAFPGDGSLPPWELPREARRQGLDAIAVTNHNQVLAARLALLAQRALGGPIVLVGDEVTATRYHLTAAGIRERVDWRRPAAETVLQIHAQGGVAMAAHPTRRWRGFDEAALRALDGSEVAHPLTIGNDDGRREMAGFYARAVQVRGTALSPIGSSDFHVLSALGLCRTYVFAREPTAAGLLEAVRAGRTVAQGPEGELFGDPARRAFIEASGRATHAARTPLEAAAAAAAGIGLLALLILGRG
jgi:predicted metal-dependent phosphoesterase TrpH